MYCAWKTIAYRSKPCIGKIGPPRQTKTRKSEEKLDWCDMPRLEDHWYGLGRGWRICREDWRRSVAQCVYDTGWPKSITVNNYLFMILCLFFIYRYLFVSKCYFHGISFCSLSIIIFIITSSLDRRNIPEWFGWFREQHTCPRKETRWTWNAQTTPGDYQCCLSPVSRDIIHYRYQTNALVI